MNNWIDLIVAVLSGLAAAIPLVAKLVSAVRSAYREKNWNKIVDMTMDYMVEAERLYTNGSARKEFVMASVKVAAVGIDYELDDVAMQKISDMIDKICDASKVINVKPAK